ncbi:MAG: RNA methyltransferase [Coriobacteriia bacterium]|nr:RNA methyltransferase [Coriobacteriia bacterium]
MPVIPLESISEPRLRAFGAMTDGELRDPKQLVGLQLATGDANLQDGLLVAESANVTLRALEAGLEPYCVLVEQRWLEPSRAVLERLEAAQPGLPVYVATPDQRKALTGYETTRGPLTTFRRLPLPQPETLLAGARRVAVLEDITNYTNIGAIFRSAAALGVDAVLISPRCYDPYYRRAARVSMGTVFQVPWTRLGAGGATDQGKSWAEDGLALLRANGFATVALALTDGAIPLDAPQLKQHAKLALVLGTEGDGLAARTIAACDYTARIPMAHGVDSLNVAAASAVAFWELRARD